MLTLRRFTKNPQISSILSTTARQFSSSNPNPSTIPVQSPADYDKLINAAGRNRDFSSVRHLLSKRTAEECYNTGNTFKFIAADASILDELLPNLAALNGWFARKHAHDTLVAQLSKLNRTSEALRVVMIMVEKKYGVTPVTFYPIINALTRKKEMKDFWRVVEVMRASEIKPDATTYNYILTAYCFVGDLVSTADVLVKMEEEGVRVNARTYDALVLGACVGGKVDGALAVMRRIVEDDGVEIMYSSHAHIIKEMVSRGYISQVMEYVRIFSGKDQKLDKENFGFLTRRLTHAKKIEEAKQVVSEMERMGLSIDDQLKEVCKKLEEVQSIRRCLQFGKVR